MNDARTSPGSQVVDTLLGEWLSGPDGRLMVAGPSGSGKSMLLAELADSVVARGASCFCLSADSGQPAFGPPGAVALAERQPGIWKVRKLSAMATLDAGRYRLPLVMAVAELLHQAPAGVCLVEAPGVTRGVTATELLAGLARVAQPDVLVWLSDGEASARVIEGLRGLGIGVTVHPALDGAARRSARAEAVARTAAWDLALAGAVEVLLPWSRIALLGDPPLREAPDAWPGRQVGLLDETGATLALGQVVGVEAATLRVLAPSLDGTQVRTLLVRDARRLPSGQLASDPARAPRTAVWQQPSSRDRPLFTPRPRPAIPLELGSPRSNRSGVGDLSALGGLFDDPLLRLKLDHERRSILFDLGDIGGLPTRIAHEVSDVLVSHAHLDHFSAFLWLLRARVGLTESCRLFGPPDLAQRVAAMVNAITWDRVGDEGPRFQVAELRGGEVVWYDVQAGVAEAREVERRPATRGLLWQEGRFAIRGAVVDHGTPVMAYAFEESRQWAVRPDRLKARGWEPGPWLGELKRRYGQGEVAGTVLLPGGSTEPLAELADYLLIERAGQKIAYATDMADTPENRATVIDLARDADLLFCEASFLRADVELARRTRHLTTLACAEIAREAGVRRLVPFHFSSRYEGEPERVYAEIVAAFERTLVPEPLQPAVQRLLASPDSP